MNTTTAPVQPWTGIDRSTLVRRGPRKRRGPATATATATATADGEHLFDFENDVLARGRRTRDTKQRISTTTVMDSQNRVSLGKVLKFMEWADDVELVTQATGYRVIVRERSAADGARVLPASKDASGRVVLTSAVRFALDIVTGDRVQAAAIPLDGHIVLLSEQDVLTAMTGPTEDQAGPREVQAVTPPSRSTRLKKRLY